MHLNFVLLRDGSFRIAHIETDERLQPVALCASGEVFQSEDMYIMPSSEEEFYDRLLLLASLSPEKLRGETGAEHLPDAWLKDISLPERLSASGFPKSVQSVLIERARSTE